MVHGEPLATLYRFDRPGNLTSDLAHRFRRPKCHLFWLTNRLCNISSLTAANYAIFVLHYKNASRSNSLRQIFMNFVAKQFDIFVSFSKIGTKSLFDQTYLRQFVEGDILPGFENLKTAKCLLKRHQKHLTNYIICVLTRHQT